MLMMKIPSTSMYTCACKISSYLGDELVHIQVTFHHRPPTPNTVCSAVWSTKQLLLTNVATVRSMSGPEAAEATSSKSVDSRRKESTSAAVGCSRLFFFIFDPLISSSTLNAPRIKYDQLVPPTAPVPYVTRASPSFGGLVSTTAQSCASGAGRPSGDTLEKR